MVCQPAHCTEQWLHGLVMYQVFLYPNGCFRSILLCWFQEEEGTVIADITAWRCGQAEQPPAAFSGESWKGKEEGGGREGGGLLSPSVTGWKYGISSSTTGAGSLYSESNFPF